MTHKYPLSVIVHTKNSAKTLESCLQSASFADEIIIVDMKSDDQTIKIAKKFTDKIFVVDDSGYVETVRNFGISKANYDWIFLLDADEEFSEGLKIWIESFVTSQKTTTDVNAYFVPRKNYIFQQEVRHSGWWPDYQLRFFKKGSVNWSEKIHSQPEINGKTKKLNPDSEICISHQNYESVTQFIDRLNRYTSITASEKKLGTTVSSLKIVNQFSDEFVRRLFKWDGIKDKSLGLGLAFLQSMYELIILMKQWENEKFFEKEESELDVVNSISNLSSTINYWIADWHVNNSSGFNKIIWGIRRKLKW